METLKLDKAEAKKQFKSAPEWFRQVLISTFGAGTFSEKITDRISTFENLCNETGTDPEDYNKLFGTLDENAYRRLKLAAKVLNEGWEPNWKDTNERKWFPIFSLSSGFGFSYSGYGYTDAYTYVGSRLCFKSEELSDFAAKTFLEDYKAYLT